MESGFTLHYGAAQLPGRQRRLSGLVDRRLRSCERAAEHDGDLWHLRGNANANAYSDTDGNAYGHANSDSDTDSYCHVYAYTNRNGHAYSHGDVYAHTNAHAHLRHTHLVGRPQPPVSRGALGRRLFPGQWEGLRHGRTQCGRNG